MAAMLGSVSSLECLGATAILFATRGSWAHQDTQTKSAKKAAKEYNKEHLLGKEYSEINNLSLLFLFDSYF